MSLKREPYRHTVLTELIARRDMAMALDDMALLEEAEVWITRVLDGGHGWATQWSDWIIIFLWESDADISSQGY